MHAKTVTCSGRACRVVKLSQAASSDQRRGKKDIDLQCREFAGPGDHNWPHYKTDHEAGCSSQVEAEEEEEPVPSTH